VQRHVLPATLRAICATGRGRLRVKGGVAPDPLRWDDGPPWQFVARIAAEADRRPELTGVFRRGAEELALGEPALVHAAGVLFANGTLAPMDDSGAFALLAELRRAPRVSLDTASLPDVVEAIGKLPSVPPLALPRGSEIAESSAEPVPCVSLRPDPSAWRVH